MVSQITFSCFVVALAFQRLLEVFKSRRQVSNLIHKGAKEHSSGHFPVMVLIHATWLMSMLAEVWIFERVFNPAVATVAALLFLAGQSLRFLSMRELKERWTVRIITVPNADVVRSGIYKYVRHPIYLGVVLEIFSAPLLHSAYVTSFVFSISNALLLRVRIREEEKALGLS